MERGDAIIAGAERGGRTLVEGWIQCGHGGMKWGGVNAKRGSYKGKWDETECGKIYWGRVIQRGWLDWLDGVNRASGIIQDVLEMKRVGVKGILEF